MPSNILSQLIAITKRSPSSDHEEWFNSQSIVLEQEIQRNELKYESILPLDPEPNLKNQEKKNKTKQKAKKEIRRQTVKWKRNLNLAFDHVLLDIQKVIKNTGKIIINTVEWWRTTNPATFDHYC